MSYVIAGRTIKNEYLALGTLLSTVAGAVYASSGKKTAPVAPAKSSTEALVDSVKSTFKSDDEESFIRDWIAKAEKEEAKH